MKIADSLSAGFLKALYKALQDEFKVVVKSESWRKAKIIIEGIDYTVNIRRINIVVYDTEDRKLIDSVCFDAHYADWVFKHKQI